MHIAAPPRHPPRIGGPMGRGVPPILRPVLRAYVLGYISSTAPRLLTLLLTHLGRKRNLRDVKPNGSFPSSLIQILKGGLELKRFPTFCAALVGGSTFLEIPLRRLFARLLSFISVAAQGRLARLLSTFAAAWFSLKLLQSKKSDAFVDHVTEKTPTGTSVRPVRFAGRTIDLTLFAVTRAFDAVVGELWSRRRAKRIAAGRWTKVEHLTSIVTDSSIFATSCAIIMWAWIYTPDRLPRSYNKWIKTAAAVDTRLIIALRRCRWGEIQYGVETGQAPLLQGMCKDYNLPLSYGDPVQSIPFPCELVHMSTGENCEYHALSRWARSFLWAISTYVPINLVLILRSPSKKGIIRGLRSSARSSAFLASFIALFYYGICLGRTRAGPLLLGTHTAARQQIDSGVCVGTGCTLCGWSVLIENAGRRKELGLFVAPRALATLLPRRYVWEKQWRETAAFAVSTAVVFAYAAEKPERVRGVFGKVLGTVLIPGA